MFKEVIKKGIKEYKEPVGRPGERINRRPRPLLGNSEYGGLSSG